MPQRLPLIPAVPNYRVGTVLNGVAYILDVRWNGRESAWYLDLLAEDETPIAHGVKLVLGVMHGLRSSDPSFPVGVFLCSDLTSAGVDAGFDDMGVRVVVLYYTQAELDAA